MKRKFKNLSTNPLSVCSIDIRDPDLVTTVYLTHQFLLVQSHYRYSAEQISKVFPSIFIGQSMIPYHRCGFDIDIQNYQLNLFQQLRTLNFKSSRYCRLCMVPSLCIPCVWNTCLSPTYHYRGEDLYRNSQGYQPYGEPVQKFCPRYISLCDYTS